MGVLVNELTIKRLVVSYADYPTNGDVANRNMRDVLEVIVFL